MENSVTSRRVGRHISQGPSLLLLQLSTSWLSSLNRDQDSESSRSIISNGFWIVI